MSVSKMCPNCMRNYVPELADQPGFNIKYRQWKNGRLIQNVWPDATPTQREQLQTGICSDACLDNYLNVVDKGRP